MLGFNPSEAQNRMKSIQSHYNQLFKEIDRNYRINITGLMSEGWVSPNGKIAVEKVAKDLNFILDRINSQVRNSFEKLNSACIIAMKALTDSKLGGGHYEGPYYQSMTFEISNTKFNADNAKTHLNGKLYIYENKLTDVTKNIQKFSVFVSERLDSIEENAKKVPIEDEGDEIRRTIEVVFKSIKQELANLTKETCDAITTKLSETDADVVQAKKNAQAELEKTGSTVSSTATSSEGSSSNGTATTSTSSEDNSSEIGMQIRDIPVTAAKPTGGNYSQRYTGTDMNPAAGTFNVSTGNPTYSMSDADVAKVAAIVYGEAVEGSPGDALAVASVMANRIEGGRNWGGTSEGLLGVATAPKQFVAYGGRKYNNFMTSYQSGNMNEGMQICMQAVRDVMNGVRNNNYESFRGNGVYNRYF